eukprot:COSAG04_NODE_17586_length_465_cov_0.743169_1_plen_90_part_10
MRLTTRRLAAVTLLGLCYPDGAGSQSSSEVALADIDGSGDVGVNDLLLLLSAFGREGDVNACVPPAAGAGKFPQEGNTKSRPDRVRQTKR